MIAIPQTGKATCIECGQPGATRRRMPVGHRFACRPTEPETKVSRRAPTGKGSKPHPWVVVPTTNAFGLPQGFTPAAAIAMGGVADLPVRTRRMGAWLVAGAIAAGIVLALIAL